MSVRVRMARRSSLSSGVSDHGDAPVRMVRRSSLSSGTSDHGDQAMMKRRSSINNASTEDDDAAATATAASSSSSRRTHHHHKTKRRSSLSNSMDEMHSGHSRSSEDEAKSSSQKQHRMKRRTSLSSGEVPKHSDREPMRRRGSVSTSTPTEAEAAPTGERHHARRRSSISSSSGHRKEPEEPAAEWSRKHKTKRRSSLSTTSKSEHEARSSSGSGSSSSRRPSLSSSKQMSRRNITQRRSSISNVPSAEQRHSSSSSGKMKRVSSSQHMARRSSLSSTDSPPPALTRSDHDCEDPSESSASSNSFENSSHPDSSESGEYMDRMERKSSLSHTFPSIQENSSAVATNNSSNIEQYADCKGYDTVEVKEVSENVFIFFTTKQEGDLVLNYNMIVFREDNHLTLINPLRLCGKGRTQLQALGTVTRLIRLGHTNQVDSEIHDAFYISKYTRLERWEPVLPDGSTRSFINRAFTPNDNGHYLLPNCRIYTFERDGASGSKIYESVLLLEIKKKRFARTKNLLVTHETLQSHQNNDHINLAARSKLTTQGLLSGQAVIPREWIRNKDMQGKQQLKQFQNMVSTFKDFEMMIGTTGVLLAKNAKDYVVMAIEKAL